MRISTRALPFLKTDFQKAAWRKVDLTQALKPATARK